MRSLPDAPELISLPRVPDGIPGTWAPASQSSHHRAVTTELASCNPATWVGDNCLTALPMQWAASRVPACTRESALIATQTMWEEQLTWICLHTLLLWITILSAWGKRQCPRLIWRVLITQAQYFYPSCTERESHVTGTHFLPCLSHPTQSFTQWCE